MCTLRTLDNVPQRTNSHSCLRPVVHSSHGPSPAIAVHSHTIDAWTHALPSPKEMEEGKHYRQAVKHCSHDRTVRNNCHVTAIAAHSAARIDGE